MWISWTGYPNLHAKKPLAISEASCSITLTMPLTLNHKGFEKPHCSSYPAPTVSITFYKPLPSRPSTSITMTNPLFAPTALLSTEHSTWNNTGQRLGVKLCPHGQNSHWITKQLTPFWIKEKKNLGSAHSLSFNASALKSILASNGH